MFTLCQQGVKTKASPCRRVLRVPAACSWKPSVFGSCYDTLADEIRGRSITQVHLPEHLKRFRTRAAPTRGALQTSMSGAICDAVTSIPIPSLSSNNRSPLNPTSPPRKSVFNRSPSLSHTTQFLPLSVAMAIDKSEKVAIGLGFVGAAFTLLAYEQTFISTTNSILVGFAISLVALGIKELDLMT